MQLSTVGPASDAARAQLLLALLVLALLPVAWLAHPRPNHGLIFDLGPIPEQLRPGLTAEHAGWIRPHIRSWRSNGFVMRDMLVGPPPGPSGTRHRLDLLPTGGLLLDSRPVDVERLRARLDLLTTRTSGWVDFRPHPEARHEDVVETLAAVARSAFDRLRLDNSRYAGAFAAATAYRPGPPRPEHLRGPGYFVDRRAGRRKAPGAGS
jgi:hypothetical protein